MNCFLQKFAAALLLTAALCFGTGCETLETQSGTASATGVPAVEENRSNAIDTTLNRGDRLVVEISDVAGIPPAYQQTVREDGTISLPLNQTVVAAGKSKGELEKAIYDLYVPKFFRRMTVNVKAEERFFFVTGEVRNPGQKQHTGNITAMKAIAAAGDFTDFANKSKIEVIRADGTKLKLNGKKALKNPSLDIPVYPNDRVHVDRRFL